MKYRILVLTFAVFAFVGCSNKKCKMQFTTQEIASWTQWFEDNKKSYVHLSSHNDSVSTNHNDAIDDLISLFYNGNDTLRHDYRMISWRLNEFYPINNENVDGYERYLGVEKQVDSLLNFNTNLDYLVRRKSALKRLMYEFRIRMYEDVLAGSMKKATKALFEKERKAWEEYHNATSEAFGINVLRKESYNFKAVFWNNYDVDIMDHRLKSLLYMCFKNPAIYSKVTMSDWESVERGYNQLKGQLDSMNNPDYDYSYDEKVNALSEDEETFKAFMHIHEALLRKLGISDSSWLLHLKAQTLERFDQYDDIDRFQIN